MMGSNGSKRGQSSPGVLAVAAHVVLFVAGEQEDGPAAIAEAAEGGLEEQEVVNDGDWGL